ncbi:MAG TPA: class I SAM-dependent methyltransferase [Flavipsychrobacter sp.]|nr:class I SAM-dependent methyltransferase [Flavipsychrobacter sp.]
MHTPKFPNFSQFDTYIVRNELNYFIQSKRDAFRGDILDIGCGRMPYKDWIQKNTGAASYTGLDIYNPIYNDDVFKPDMYWDGVTIPVEKELYDTAMLIEVLEHCEYPEKVIAEAWRILKPGGKLIFSVPFIFYYHDVPYDFSRFSFYKLKSLFRDAGFTTEDIFGYGNWNSALAHFWSLWIKRSPLPKVFRFICYLLGLPLYMLLYRKKEVLSNLPLHAIAIGHFGVVTKIK